MDSNVMQLGVTHELSTGVLTRVDVDDEHYYFLDGIFCLGMTTVLDIGAPFPQALREYLRRTDPQESAQNMEYKRDRGSGLHGALELLMNGVNVQTEELRTDYEKKAVETFIRFMRFLKPQKFRSEFTVADKDLRVAGTVDFVGVVDPRRVQMLLDPNKYLKRDNDGDWEPKTEHQSMLDGDVELEKIIIDWKFTGRNNYNHKVQVAGYADMYAKSYADESPVSRKFTWRFSPQHKANFDFSESLLTVTSFQRIYDTAIEYLGGFPEPPVITVYPKTFELFKKVAINQDGFIEDAS